MGGFFDRFERRPEPADETNDDEFDTEQPGWTGHPHAIVPGRSNQVATLFSTDAATLVLCCVDAYPIGLEFSLRLLTARPDRSGHHSPIHFGGFVPPDDGDDSRSVRLGIEFADGRTWASTAPLPEFPISSDRENVVVMNQGGGGGGRFWEFEFWLWPLPPDGPLTFHADWPAQGVPETVTIVDATELRTLARSAVTIELPT